MLNEPENALAAARLFFKLGIHSIVVYCRYKLREIFAIRSYNHE